MTRHCVGSFECLVEHPADRSRLVARQRILVVTDDVLTEAMAGPAIRAWQISDALAAGHDVVLATTSPTCERKTERFGAESAGPDRFAELERWCTVVLLQGYVLNHVPALRTTDKVMVVDLYDPLHLETLELTMKQPEPDRSTNVASSVRILGEQILRGDFFVCASDKQRDLWMGFLSAAGRVNPANYDLDPTLRRLIDVVPFGLPDASPERTGAALRRVVPGIGPDDEILLWGGGVYDWLDPLTAIRAVDAIRHDRPNVRLYFMGVRHPNTAIEESRMLVAARSMASDLGLTGTHVFFNDGWVAYDDRAGYLLEADLALSLHMEHLETNYSFRTRILDCIWAGLPIVSTRGDTFAEIIDREGLGRVVPGGDVAAVAGAISDLLADTAELDACRERAAVVADRFRWSRVLAPLVRFCDDPHRAADAASLRAWPAAQTRYEPPAAAAEPSTPLPAQVSFATRLLAAYRRGGVRALVAGVARRLRKIASPARD